MNNDIKFFNIEWRTPYLLTNLKIEISSFDMCWHRYGEQVIILAYLNIDMSPFSFPKSHLEVIKFNSVLQCIHWSAHIVCNAIVFEDLMAKFQTDNFNNFHVTWGSICCISGIFPLFWQISMNQVRITGEYHIFYFRCHWKLYVNQRKTS